MSDGIRDAEGRRADWLSLSSGMGDSKVINALRAELAAERERAEKIVAVAHKYGWNGVENSKLVWQFFDDLIAAEREQKAALAAALGVAEKVISEAMKAVSVMNLDKAGCWLSAYQLSGMDYAAILAARDDAQRRKGAEIVCQITGIDDEWQDSDGFNLMRKLRAAIRRLIRERNG